MQWSGNNAGAGQLRNKELIHYADEVGLTGPTGVNWSLLSSINVYCGIPPSAQRYAGCATYIVGMFGM